jgi:hypothetical protein
MYALAPACQLTSPPVGGSSTVIGAHLSKSAPPQGAAQVDRSVGSEQGVRLQLEKSGGTTQLAAEPQGQGLPAGSRHSQAQLQVVLIRPARPVKSSWGAFA